MILWLAETTRPPLHQCSYVSFFLDSTPRSSELITSPLSLRRHRTRFSLWWLAQPAPVILHRTAPAKQQREVDAPVLIARLEGLRPV